MASINFGNGVSLNFSPDTTDSENDRDPSTTDPAVIARLDQIVNRLDLLISIGTDTRDLVNQIEITDEPVEVDTAQVNTPDRPMVTPAVMADRPAMTLDCRSVTGHAAPRAGTNDLHPGHTVSPATRVQLSAAGNIYAVTDNLTVGTNCSNIVTELSNMAVKEKSLSNQQLVALGRFVQRIAEWPARPTDNPAERFNRLVNTMTGLSDTSRKVVDRNRTRINKINELFGNN